MMRFGILFKNCIFTINLSIKQLLNNFVMVQQENIIQRKKTLRKLQVVIKRLEDEILSALHNDFKKPAVESFLSELHVVNSELKNTIKNIHNWNKPKRVWPSVLNFPSSDWIYREPYGKVLIISPWNYPFQLAILPLISAFAAGNSVTLKPSELAPKTADIIVKIVEAVFDNSEVTVILGNKTVAEELLQKKWDYIFFTGSTKVGKIIAEIAAKNLTPVTLELGGKNPCIVDDTAHLQLAAKRIVWGKLLNAGQTCIAPDYILVHQKVKSTFVQHLIQEIQNALGDNPQESRDFARIINKNHWERLAHLTHNQNIIYGGNWDESDCYFAPTLIDEPTLDSPLMQDEIFGPILPIISYQNPSDIETVITQFDRSLSLYVFSTKPQFYESIIQKFSFGGGCINDTMVYFANKRLPFGGIGASGMGAYHGKFSFDTFSHAKPVLKKANWLDVPLRYAPYKNKFNILKKLLHWL